VRQIIRAGHWASHTSSLAPHHVQGNLVILPQALAGDFLRFCQKNPKACPLLAVSEPGAAELPELGRDLDVRTDVPRYRVFRAGELVAEPTDILDLWRADLVTFVLGCSFSFEWALLQAGIVLRHIEQGKNVAMYRTNVSVVPAGSFAGPLVVSMRPMRASDAIRAVQVTSRFPQLHGAPVHIGNPELLGIADLARPDYGDGMEPRSDELPVFWACGVTPQAALEQARPELCITHCPGAMLVTDLENARVSSF
jgi:uncharacterized protein YcsI (UPF0317 family)